MSTGRSKRASAKKVDYAKEQEFSDGDLFEDSEPEDMKKNKRGRKPRGSTGTVMVEESVISHAPTSATPGAVPTETTESRMVYTEKGYDTSLPTIRERFPFLPEYAEDGSPRIELIVGRRRVDDKEDAPDGEEEEEEDETTPRKTRGKKDKTPPNKKKESEEIVEYEYLVKYRGRSYLHLEWKTGADLESMNKSAKGIYRRWLKKLSAGTEEDLENPDFDPAYIVPGKILDEANQEVTVELTDKELLRWEKEREKELEAEEGNDSDDSAAEGKEKNGKGENGLSMQVDGDIEMQDATKADGDEEKSEVEKTDPEDDWPEGEIDYVNISMDKLREIINRDGPYYPVIEGSDNPYRDGYITEPPKKPRASYLFFQATMRSFYARRSPHAPQSELMTILGNTWQNMTDEEKAPFQKLAQDESQQFEKEKILKEKAQKPTEVWQPLRRCREVLERLATDSFADIFQEPVDLEDFPDYSEIVDFPMDLSTVRKGLNNRKYQAPEQFARDMRKVWNNCKIYNQHGSAIWYVGDYMSKQFERLYHAWVLEYRERYMRWGDPRARPWEHSCRIHDGKCKTKDSDMVLCDHCDGMYGYKCLKVPLKKIPKKAWHCPDCKPKLKTVKGMRMLSAIAENAAQKRAELGDIPKKTVNQTMYLVKWAGLGYEHCTWETRQEINADSLISEFHKLNNSLPDEADMTEKTLVEFFKTVKHVNPENSGGSGDVMSPLKLQLYAQSRALQFARFGIPLPEKVGNECGPKTWSHNFGTRRPVSPNGDVGDEATLPPLKEVVECVSDLVFKVAQNEPLPKTRSQTCLPPPMTGEYDTVVPITSKGLMMNVGEVNGSVAFLGYRRFPDGSKGPAEVANLIHSVGDKIIAVDGKSTDGKTFKEVITMLRESGKNKFAYMRFIETRFSNVSSELHSVGDIGRYAIDTLQKKFTEDRQLLLAQRMHHVQNEVEDEPENGAGKDEQSSAANSDEESVGSGGSFEPESDDELVVDGNADEVKALLQKDGSPPKPIPVESPAEEKVTQETEQSAEPIVSSNNEKINAQPIEAPASSEDVIETKEIPIYRQETTQSLAYRLLEVDVGYSSDEGGDGDCAFFVDGVDSTFTSKLEVDEFLPERKNLPEELIPARTSEFSALNDRSKLVSAVSLTTVPPDLDDFDNFPFPSSKQVAEEKTKADLEASKKAKAESPTKAKLSTVKVEQVNIATGETIHIWANVEAAAATLQLQLPQLRQVLRGEYDEDIGDEVGGYKWRYALAGAKATAGTGSTSKSAGGKKAKEAWLEFRDKLYDPSEPYSYKNGNRLRDYQVDGVNWLASTWYKKQGCILADEMGLGKTVQIACYIEHLHRAEKVRGPFLVVVPLSTVEHWRREFEGWTDMNCCIYHDRQRVWRDVLREYEWYFEDRPHTAEYLKFDVLVTTYDTLIGDFDVVSQIPFRVAVVDEAHRLRNQKGKLLECMREISAQGTMRYGFQSRVLMSGTPLQNDLTELWTLLNFIEPFKFSDIDVFQDAFGNIANRSQVESLQQMISPFMLRRVKEDVAKDIPAKEETVIDVELTSIQKQYYRAIFEHNHAFLNIGAARNVAPKLMNIQMELRKVCNHPFLLDGVEHRETDRQYKEFSDKGLFQGKSPEEKHKMLNEHGYIMTSGKMLLLDKLLPKLRQEGHKVLIFSQMVKMLDLISEYCDFRDFKYERLDGRIRGSERQKSIDRFEKDPSSFLFIISTKAGGVGINLTAADICIIFDSDWNPQNDVQAQARCHRIGQTKEVRIYRLVTSRSFEQEMFDRASKKLGLEQAVLGTFEKEQEDDKPSQKEMEQLLKRGAYALLEDEDDQITKEFCADDIDTILAKRTRTRVVEGAKTASWLNKQGMIVTKSKFSAEAGGSTLDMDDPLFWQKVMPDFVTPSIMLQKLNDLTGEVEGVKKGPGRGRWRQKRAEEAAKKMELTDQSKEVTAETVEDTQEESKEGVTKEDSKEGDGETKDDTDVEDGNEDDSDSEKEKKFQLSRTNVRKVAKFMSDMKSMMEGILVEEEPLSDDEKDTCQKLLLTISVKEKMFNEEQRRVARGYLKRIEGGRRRRCRTSEQRFTPGSVDEDTATPTRPELMIVAKKRRKRRKRSEIEADEAAAAAAAAKKKELDEDGYLRHSDSEGEWSDVADDLYGDKNKAKDKISSKEAKRRRQWAADDDEATAAGRPWPVFPRHMVKKVLNTVLDEVIKYDEEQGGIFNVPVPKDEFPEYYEQISKPMDYGTMKDKLDNDEYRSAQSMQKDFILILQNCRKFNSTTSDIVKEAREQHLMRPRILKESAMKHGLFLSEDGSVLEIVEEKKSPKKSRGRKSVGTKGEEGDVQKKKKKAGEGGAKSQKLRIKIRNTTDKEEASSKRQKDNGEDSESEPVPRKKARLDPEAEEPASQDSGSQIFVNPAFWKAGREKLDGSFAAARAHVTQLGAWELPEDVAADRFEDVAKNLLTKMAKYDKHTLFAEPVTEEEAPGYDEIVKNPMDFGTMRKKAIGKGYGSGSKAARQLYNDFILVFDNCLLYNDDDSDVTEEAARVFALLPEAFCSACQSVSQRK